MALKGITLGITAAVFITSLIFTIAGLTNTLKVNIITGAVLGSSQLAAYSIIPLILQGDCDKHYSYSHEAIAPKHLTIYHARSSSVRRCPLYYYLELATHLLGE